MINKYKILPVFIPFAGCKSQCIFCNQKVSSGNSRIKVNPELIELAVKDMLVHAKNGEKLELAFYGGSFTSLPMELQKSILKRASRFIDSKQVSRIRISARPDAINKDIIKILKQGNVEIIELGIQSLDDVVLKTIKRGYNSQKVFENIKMLHENNIRISGQLMLGLPGASEDSDIFTSDSLIKLKVEMARIHPTIVLNNTELNKMFVKKEYTPLSLEQAVERCAKVVLNLELGKVNVVKIGLLIQDNYEQQITAGPYSQNFGELTRSEILVKRIVSIISNEKIKYNKLNSSKDANKFNICIHINKKDRPKLFAFKKQALNKIKQCLKNYNIQEIQVIEDSKVIPGFPRVKSN